MIVLPGVDFGTMIKAIHQNAIDHGWWEGGVEARDFDELCTLIVDELSELHESYRRGNLHKGCDKLTGNGLPILTCLEEELADVAIRLFDMCGAYGVTILDVHNVPELTGVSNLGAQIRYLTRRICDLGHGTEPTETMWGQQHVFEALVEIATKYGVDLLEAIAIKHAYNVNRPYRHGNKLA